ncbi:Crp/Fnr family transcriptional regulator [Nocardioides sp.]|uniref:Crp/Fnr family transcriptional regulator n=1 Tax=Nocardioides sp. TaxID=35761 RepID=UPI002ED1943E
MADVDVVEVLRDTDLFAEVGNRGLKTIARHAKVVEHAAGAEIAQEGGGAAGFHVIVEGTASVNVHDRERPELGPGDYFGEIALIDGKPRSATIVATSPLTTVALVSWDFRPILNDEPGVALGLLKVMCARLRAAEAG